MRGEVWWAELPPPSGSDPGFRRPVLVVQGDAFNMSRIQTVVCAIITSNLRLAEAPGNVFLKADYSKLPKDSVVNVSQLITLDKSILIEIVGSIPKKLMKQVDAGIKLVLDL